MFTIVGKQVVDVRIEGDTSIVLICSDGTAFEMCHMVDCCEVVEIESHNGTDLRGNVQSMAEHVVDHGLCDDGIHRTTTTYTLQLESGTMAIVWQGSSNGYYSERPHFGQCNPPIALSAE